MLYWFFYQELFPVFSPFRVFSYITFRTAYASISALFICLILGPWLIRKLRGFQIGQIVREEGPRSHQAKQGTPTMGGLLINISILIPTLLWADLTNVYIWIAAAALAAFGAVGFADDYLKVIRRQNLGLTARTKFGLQFAISFVLGIVLVFLHARGQYSTNMNVPFLKFFSPDLLIDSLLTSRYTYPAAFIFFFLFVGLVLVGASNAVNLTDGLDGLAIGLTVIASGALTVLTYAAGHAQFAAYLEIQRVPQAAELTIFCGSMVGASLGFLWYNAHPADIFMGDVGSLALGGAMGTVAVLVKQEILLLSIGGVFVIEALSVILQVASYKLRGKRIFKMAPLHHHFEALGWQESKIIARFWIAGLILAMFSLTTLKLR